MEGKNPAMGQLLSSLKCLSYTGVNPAARNLTTTGAFRAPD
jgi:hypothetical protein